METLPAVSNQNGSMFFDVAKFEHAQRVAKLFASSTMVPDHFRENIGNCLIAMNYADRIGADLFMTMQAMCVIHGKPGVEGKLVIALINNCGRFDPVEFEEIGDLRKPTKDEDGCIAYTKDLKSGKMLKGPLVDWAMVKAEGWLGKNGSKWKTMAPLMFRYRAATYFARTFCPEVLLGMQTREEIQDVVTLRQNDLGEFEAGLLDDDEPKVKDIMEKRKPPTLYKTADSNTEESNPNQPTGGNGGSPGNNEKSDTSKNATEAGGTNDETASSIGDRMNEAQLWEVFQSQMKDCGITTADSFARCRRFVYHNAKISGKNIAETLRIAINNRKDFVVSMASWKEPEPENKEQYQQKPTGDPAHNGPPAGTRMDGLPKWDEDHPWWPSNWEKMRSGDGVKTGFGAFIAKNMDTFGSVPDDIKTMAAEKFARVYDNAKAPWLIEEVSKKAEQDQSSGQQQQQNDETGMDDVDPEAAMRTELRSMRTELVSKKQHNAELYSMATKNLIGKKLITTAIPAQMGIDECNLVIDEMKDLDELRRMSQW